ncbi:MAG: AAA family ATPase [Syntrophobacteraceae bacterium]
MKIVRLDLIACGPFTDLSLDLSRGEEGFHLIYGPNEAGKSSALRALGYFLFGIPDRCEDHFLHPYQKLRIGGAIKTGAARIIEAVRRKGRANTLRKPDDSLLEDSLWFEACGRISAEDFSRRFGIDHNALVEGGSEIIKGEGELAQILFTAGAGLASFRKIEEQVRDEANDLFKPGGSKPKINELLSNLRKDQSKLRELQLPNEKYDGHFKACQDALAKAKELEAQLAGARQERNRLQRLKSALPLIGKRKSLLMELSGYRYAPILAEGFSEKRQQAVQALRLEEQNLEQTKKRIEKLHLELGALGSSSAILDFSKQISELYLKLGSYRDALAARPTLTVQKKAFEDQARDLLAQVRKDFPLERIEELRLRTDEEIIIRNLGARRGNHTANLENALEHLRRLTVEIAELSEQLAAMAVPRDTARLLTVVEEAKSCARIEEEHSQIEVNILSAQQQADIDLARLDWAGSLDDLERLRIPELETIDEFDGTIRESTNQINAYAREIERFSKDIRKIESQISALRASEVVSIEDLDKARSFRETGWKLLRAAMEGAIPCEQDHTAFIREVPSAKTLPDAFEKSVLIADDLSDRLRREAHRVAEYNGLVSTARALELERNEAVAKKEELEKRLERIHLQWENFWVPCGVLPGSPAQMRKWAAKRAELVRARMDLRKLWAEAQYRSNRIEELKNTLEECLKELGLSTENDEPLRNLVAKAKNFIEIQTRIASERGLLENDLQQKKRELRKAEAQSEKAAKELEQWRQQWANALSPLGLGAKSIPEQANGMLGKLQEIFACLKDSKSLGRQLEKLDADCELFEKQAASLVGAVAPDLHGIPAENAVPTIYDLMTHAREEKIKKEDLTNQIIHEEKELTRALDRNDRLHIEISAMLAEAACANIEDFFEAERKSATQKELKGKLEQIEEQLIELAAGLSLEQFCARTEEQDPDLLQPLIANLDEKIVALNEDKSEIYQTIGSEKTRLSTWNGQGEAAEVAQQIQARLADLENRTRQYSRLKIAQELLLRAKERHRQRSQGPVIKRTSELFQTLTLGSFDGVIAGDDSGKNAIVGLRPGGEPVPVRAMSQGTADQLYLALRLASFEHYASKNEPLPLVLDDILVHFDDERSRATLRVLGELSKITQIIMFTHHSHLVELAKSELGSERLFVLDLH